MLIGLIFNRLMAVLKALMTVLGGSMTISERLIWVLHGLFPIIGKEMAILGKLCQVMVRLKSMLYGSLAKLILCNLVVVPHLNLI